MPNFDAVIDEVASKYGYSSELVLALKRVVPIMAEEKDEEEVQIIIDTLRRVPIFLFDKEPKQEDIDSIERQMLQGRNSDVTIIDEQNGEYGKTVTPAAYCPRPVFDAQMNLIDRIGFIYLTNINQYSSAVQKYGTQINLSHLIHELGHACASQKGEYTQLEDGRFSHRVGTYISMYEVDRDSRTVRESVGTGIFIEEALNTIEEERILYKLLGVENYTQIPDYVPSKYQGTMTRMMRQFIKEIGPEPFNDFRFKGDRSKINKLQELFGQTPILRGEKSDEFYKKIEELMMSFRKTVMSNNSKAIVEKFFSDYRSLYFEPSEEQLDFMGFLDRILEQRFNFYSVQHRFDIMNDAVEDGGIKISEAYANVIGTLHSELNVLLLQYKDVLLQEKRKARNEDHER